MNKYIAIIQGEGGCDYTLGCNTLVEEYTASSLEEVRDIIIEEQKEEGFIWCREYNISDIEIHQVYESLEFDLSDYYQDFTKLLEEEEKEEEESKILKQAQEILKKRNKV